MNKTKVVFQRITKKGKIKNGRGVLFSTGEEHLVGNNDGTLGLSLQTFYDPKFIICTREHTYQLSKILSYKEFDWED